MDEKTYWNNFYNNKETKKECSDFCNFIINYFETVKNITRVIDCGCGNGRDSYELSKKYIVDAVDNSGFIPESKKNLEFMCKDFVNMNKDAYNLVYSRFTFHSITNENHNDFLKTIKNDTYLAIEARSSKGIDEYVHHGKTHYRNYIDCNYLKDLLMKNNFEILFSEEGKGMAKYKDEDPICIRIICLKR
ncbi:MAG: class I SAM-dependent methyltransferase [Methylophilaceae bacterium]